MLVSRLLDFHTDVCSAKKCILLQYIETVLLTTQSTLDYTPHLTIHSYCSYSPHFKHFINKTTTNYSELPIKLTRMCLDSAEGFTSKPVRASLLEKLFDDTIFKLPSSMFSASSSVKKKQNRECREIPDNISIENLQIT